MAAAAPAGLKSAGRKSPLRRALGREYFGLRFHFHTPPIWRNAHFARSTYTQPGAPNGRKKKEAPPPPPPKFVPPPPPPKNEVVENALRKIREGRMLTEKEMAALEEEEAKMDSALDKLQEGKMLFQAEMDALEREMGRGVQQTWSKAPVGVYEGPKYTGGWGSSGREVADLRAKLKEGKLLTADEMKVLEDYEERKAAEAARKKAEAAAQSEQGTAEAEAPPPPPPRPYEGPVQEDFRAVRKKLNEGKRLTETEMRMLELEDALDGLKNGHLLTEGELLMLEMEEDEFDKALAKLKEDKMMTEAEMKALEREQEREERTKRLFGPKEAKQEMSTSPTKRKPRLKRSKSWSLQGLSTGRHDNIELFERAASRLQTQSPREGSTSPYRAYDAEPSTCEAEVAAATEYLARREAVVIRVPAATTRAMRLEQAAFAAANAHLKAGHMLSAGEYATLEREEKRRDGVRKAREKVKKAREAALEAQKLGAMGRRAAREALAAQVREKATNKVITAVVNEEAAKIAESEWTQARDERQRIERLAIEARMVAEAKADDAGLIEELRLREEDRLKNASATKVQAIQRGKSDRDGLRKAKEEQAAAKKAAAEAAAAEKAAAEAAEAEAKAAAKAAYEKKMADAAAKAEAMAAKAMEKMESNMKAEEEKARKERRWSPRGSSASGTPLTSARSKGSGAGTSSAQQSARGTGTPLGSARQGSPLGARSGGTPLASARSAEKVSARGSAPQSARGAPTSARGEPTSARGAPPSARGALPSARGRAPAPDPVVE